MAITKLGSGFSGADTFVGHFLKGLTSPIWGKYRPATDLKGGARLGAALGRGLGWTIGAPARGAYHLARGGASLGLKGISSYGRHLGRNPGKVLPMTAAAIAAPMMFKDRLQKNFYHTDPNQHHTYQGLGSIKYHDPKMMKARNPYTSFIY